MADVPVKQQIKNALNWFKTKLLTDTPADNTQLALSAKGGLNLQEQVNELNSAISDGSSIVVQGLEYKNQEVQLSNGYSTIDLGKTKRVIVGATGYLISNAQVPIIVGVQARRYLRCRIPGDQAINDKCQIMWYEID